MNITQREIPMAAVSEPDFCRWLQTAAPSNAIEYYRGFLVVDAAQPGRRDIARLRHLAYWAAEQGLVHLVQRRLAPNRFAYLALRRCRTPHFLNEFSPITADHKRAETAGEP